MLKNKSLIIISVLTFIIGVLLALLITNSFSSGIHSSEFHEERYTQEYKFISPLLECDTGESKELSSFDDEIKNIADGLMQNGTITDVSYYFRDLNNGIWIGINEDDEFAPASLMKLPLMISYLKEAEENPLLVEKTYTFTKEDDNYEKQNIKPTETMVIGQNYTVRDLINRMIMYSDNSALRILLKNSGAFGMRVFTDLGVVLPEGNEDEDFMSVRTYSRFFRILYNGSYLNFANSDVALRILSLSQYDDGIVSGVPENIVVAHKFGEREVSGAIQLHDCGIVYYPKEPYIVCIMTKGSDINRLSSAISELSKVTYESVDKNF